MREVLSARSRRQAPFERRGARSPPQCGGVCCQFRCAVFPITSVVSVKYTDTDVITRSVMPTLCPALPWFRTHVEGQDALPRLFPWVRGPKVLSPWSFSFSDSFHASNCKVPLVSHFPAPLHAPHTHRAHPTKPSACPQDGHYPPTHPPGSCGLAAAGREDRIPVARRSSKKQHP